MAGFGFAGGLNDYLSEQNRTALQLKMRSQLLQQQYGQQSALSAQQAGQQSELQAEASAQQQFGQQEAARQQAAIEQERYARESLPSQQELSTYEQFLARPLIGPGGRVLMPGINVKFDPDNPPNRDALGKLAALRQQSVNMALMNAAVPGAPEVGRFGTPLSQTKYNALTGAFDGKQPILSQQVQGPVSGGPNLMQPGGSTNSDSQEHLATMHSMLNQIDAATQKYRQSGYTGPITGRILQSAGMIGESFLPQLQTLNKEFNNISLRSGLPMSGAKGSRFSVALDKMSQNSLPDMRLDDSHWQETKNNIDFMLYHDMKASGATDAGLLGQGDTADLAQKFAGFRPANQDNYNPNRWNGVPRTMVFFDGTWHDANNFGNALQSAVNDHISAGGTPSPDAINALRSGFATMRRSKGK